MCNIKCFGIIGGDKRQLYCGNAISADGFQVLYGGFDRFDGALLPQESTRSPSEAAAECDALLLPLPCTRDGIQIDAPYATAPIPADELFPLLGNKPVFCGMAQRLPFRGDMIFDYSKREDFAVANAVPTAEGAIETAMREYDGTIDGSRCLVAGYGRIGRILSHRLAALGAEVTVSARSTRDRAFIRAMGMNALDSGALCGNYDLIFNTVPALLFKQSVLTALGTQTVIIDLASMPGGVDFEAAKSLSVKAVRALSLPGKVAPKTAGRIIKNTVYHIIKEERL